MEEVVNQLKNLNLGNVTEEDIVECMRYAGRAGAILTIYHPAYNKNGVPNFFVRASNYNPKFEEITSTDRLRYPPLAFNTNYQRASTPSKPMFYATRHRSNDEGDVMSAIRTCLLETISEYDKLVEEGIRVAISLRYNILPLKLYSIFNWSEFQSNNPEYAEVNNSFTETILTMTPEHVENTKMFLDFLSERFSIPVGEDANQYKPSSVLTQYLLDKLSSYDIDGVVFPSTKVLGQELNVALLPTISDSKLIVTKVLDCEYKPNKIVEIQKRANINNDEKEVKFKENVSIEIDLN